MTLSVSVLSVLMALYKGNYFCLLFRDIFAILFKKIIGELTSLNIFH